MILCQIKSYHKILNRHVNIRNVRVSSSSFEMRQRGDRPIFPFFPCAVSRSVCALRALDCGTADCGPMQTKQDFTMLNISHLYHRFLRDKPFWSDDHMNVFRSRFGQLSAYLPTCPIQPTHVKMQMFLSTV